MGISTPPSLAERAGRMLGRAGRALARVDARAQRWLAEHGLGEGLAWAASWLIKIVVLGVLHYAAFWLALLLLFAVVAAWVARNADPGDQEEVEPEWREGHSGFGLYDKNEWRHDIGDSD